ncbi:hypothetical protein RB199_14240 [Streptomyces libani]
MDEVRDPSLPAVVGRELSEVSVGERLQVPQYGGEARVYRADLLPFPEVAHAEQRAGAPVTDQRRRQTGDGAPGPVEVQGRVAVDFGFRSGGQVDPDHAGEVSASRRTDPHTGSVRGHLERVDPHRVVGAIEGGDQLQLARRRVPARQREVALLGQGAGEQLAVGAPQPAVHVARVLSQNGEFTGHDVNLRQVELFGLPGVELHDHLARAFGGQVQLQDLRPGKGREVNHGGVRILEVDPVDVPVLVAVGVLGVEQPARIVGPVVADHAAGLVSGHAPRVGVAVDAAHPHVQPVLPRREPGDPGAVRRDRGPCALG